MSAAPYGYRYIKKTEHSEGFWEIDAAQARDRPRDLRALHQRRYLDR